MSKYCFGIDVGGTSVKCALPDDHQPARHRGNDHAERVRRRSGVRLHPPPGIFHATEPSTTLYVEVNCSVVNDILPLAIAIQPFLPEIQVIVTDSTV